MTDRSRVCQINQFESSGTPAVSLLRLLPRITLRATDPRARDREAAAPRNCYLLTQSVKAEFDPTGIPQDGLEWMAREDHV
jgi:hypothetical protein